MNAIRKLLFVFIILQNTISAQVCDCLKVSNFKESYNAFSECITFNVISNCDSTIKCIISVQSYRYEDSCWFVSWGDINLKLITSCKPPNRVYKFNANSTTELQWFPKDCIDFFGEKWTEKIIKGQEENEENKVRLCRFAFYMFHADKWELERNPFYCSEPFYVIITP